MSNTSILPASNIINITLEGEPSGLTSKNVNSLALFTTEKPNNLLPYGIYITASQCALDYGSASLTAAMANAVFSQVPNVLSGNGRLVIIPLLNSVSATGGYFTTTVLTANLANIIAVTNGNLKVTINGIAYNLSALNFSNCVTLADVANVLQNALPNANVTANTALTQITISSKKVGTSATVALAAYSGGGTDLTGSTLLNVSAGAATAGTASSGETIPAAIARTLSQVGYVGVMSTLNLEDSVILTNATAIQAMDMLYFQHFSDPLDVQGAITSISQASERQTRPLLYTAGQAQANLMKASYAGRALSTDFTGSNTAGTMNLKSLAGVVPDPGMNETLYVNAGIAGADCYVSYDGVAVVFSTGGNDFFDNPYSDLALKFALQVAGFNFLRQTNTKVPQTEQGMNGLKAAYISVLDQFVRNGSIAPGAWTSADTFGDPVIFNNNILQKGYYVFSSPVAQQLPANRTARIAPLVQIALKRAGAIHSSNVIVVVNN